MAGSDAAMENLVFPIKKRFPEKKQRFPRQDPTLDFTNPTVVQLYYTSPRGYSWSA